MTFGRKPPAISSERMKHLEFLQTAIARQAANSFAVKGWSLTVAAALYAYTATHLEWWLALLALAPPVVFYYLDALYLRQERLFRELYDDVRDPANAIPLFDMDTRRYSDNSAYPRFAWWTSKGVLRSSSVAGFHAMVVSVGLVLLIVAVVQDLSATELAKCIRNAF